MEKLNRRVATMAPREPATWPGAQKNSAKQEDFKRFVYLLFAVFQELFKDVKAEHGIDLLGVKDRKIGARFTYTRLSFQKKGRPVRDGGS